MEQYSFLREMADSWGVVAMLTIFLGICVWAFRPSSRGLHDDAAASIFRNENGPADQPKSTRKEA